MYELAPSELKYIDEASVLKYTNELDDLLTYIFSELKCISLDVFGNNIASIERIEYLEKIIKNNFYSCGLDIDKLKHFYKKYISNMDVDFINSVKNECVGYTSFGTSSIDMAVSINELLHFIHSYILNNEVILKSIPLIDKKKNDSEYPINYRGVNSSLFEQVYEQFPKSLNVGWTDMVAINDKKMIMMVRDRGHALSIEITIKNDIARIEYFIPKLCNIEMINQLPGITNKVNKESVGATGIIEVPVNILSTTLIDFISKVPTDIDMIVKAHI